MQNNTASPSPSPLEEWGRGIQKIKKKCIIFISFSAPSSAPPSQILLKKTVSYLIQNKHVLFNPFYRLFTEI